MKYRIVELGKEYYSSTTGLSYGFRIDSKLLIFWIPQGWSTTQGGARQFVDRHKNPKKNRVVEVIE